MEPQLTPNKDVWRPFRCHILIRQHQLSAMNGSTAGVRLESAKKGTLIAESSHADLERTLLFNLRGAFVLTLQSKSVLPAWQKIILPTTQCYSISCRLA